MFLLWTGCTADTPALTDKDGSGATPCTPFADKEVAYTQNGQMADGQSALGAPDDIGVVLAHNDVLTVGFIGLGSVVDAGGDDIVVHGTGSETAEVTAYLSQDGESFEYAATLTADDRTIDLGDALLRVAIYVQLVGIQGSFTADAFEALQPRCPAP